MKYRHHWLLLAVIFLIAFALGVGTYLTIEESRPLRNEYSFDIRSVADPENVIFPFHSAIEIVAKVNGGEVARTTVAEGVSCWIVPKDELAFDASISEVVCSLEGSSDIFAMHETDYDTTEVDRYELTDATVETPGPESYVFVETVFGGNNDASSNP